MFSLKLSSTCVQVQVQVMDGLVGGAGGFGFICTSVSHLL